MEDGAPGRMGIRFGFGCKAGGHLEDDVEVGANTTIDGGSTRDTIIGAGTRIDNLVQIAHNVRLDGAA